LETRSRDIVTLRSLRGTWERALKPRNRSPRTVRSYLDSLDDLAEFLESSGMPKSVTSIRASTSIVRSDIPANFGNKSTYYRSVKAAPPEPRP
jgi:hypothetical protein